MRFGLLYELQLPRPWNAGDESRLFHEALAQAVLADQLGFDSVWEVEHHFLDEYSHSSAPEVFLAAVAAQTRSIRVGHGIRQVIPNYNHPARTAEGMATLDIISNGRVDFGIGEGATRLELGGFNISAKEKRAMCLEAAEQIANMMTMEPYSGFDGKYFSMPCRNVLPKPVQKPHPPMWMACTNRETIKVAARNGLGALAFSFVDPDEARTWSGIYYDIIKSEECVPLGHSVNANLAMVSGFSLHQDREEAIRRGHEGFEFFAYALNALVARDIVPGHTDLWGEFVGKRGNRTEEVVRSALGAKDYASGIGTPEDMRRHLLAFEEAGVDQIIFLQQAGRNKHEHICESLRMFSATVMPEFKTKAPEREARKTFELAPYIAAAASRKTYMQPLSKEETPVVRAAVSRPQVPTQAGSVA